MSDAQATYNLKAVVQRTGIPAASLRAWERRYGVPAPVRKENGHRVYPAGEVERLLRMKALIAQGMTAGQAASQVEVVKSTVVEPRTEAERLQAELRAALGALDVTAANRLFAAALDLLPAEQVCLSLVRPMLKELTPFGRTYLRSKLGALLLHAAAAGLSRTAVVMAPDPFDLEPLIAAIFLSRRGYGVIYVEGTEPPPGVEPDLLIDPRKWGKRSMSPEQIFS